MKFALDLLHETKIDLNLISYQIRIKTVTYRLTLEGQTSPLCSCSIFLTGSSCFPTFISHLTHKVKGQRAQGGGAGGDTYASAWGDMISVELHALRGVREAEEEEEHTHTHIHVRTGQVVKEDKTLTLVTRFLPRYEVRKKDGSTKGVQNWGTKLSFSKSSWLPRLDIIHT